MKTSLNLFLWLGWLLLRCPPPQENFWHWALSFATVVGLRFKPDRRALWLTEQLLCSNAPPVRGTHTVWMEVGSLCVRTCGSHTIQKDCDSELSDNVFTCLFSSTESTCVCVHWGRAGLSLSPPESGVAETVAETPYLYDESHKTWLKFLFILAL